MVATTTRRGSGPAGPPRPAAKPVVLVVDDDAAVREALHLILDEAYAVLDAADAHTALATVRAARVDLVVLDLLLPDTDGLEVLQELKALDPALPVLVVTGVKTVRTTVAAMKRGAVDYLTKPFDEDELLAAMRAALRAPARPSPGRGPACRAARETPDAHRIVVFDEHLGRRAAVAVLLRRFGQVEAAGDVGALAGPCSGRTLSLLLGVERLEPRVLGILRAARAHRPGCPILVALARDDREVVRELGAFGVPQVMRPPFDLADVMTRVEAVLAGRDVPRQGLVRFSRPVHAAIDHVEAYYAGPLDVERLGAAGGVSASHLAHVFRAETGLSVKDFVTRVRVEVAKGWLASTGESLAEIAAKTGFTDASHLAHTFRAQTGRSAQSHRRPRR